MTERGADTLRFHTVCAVTPVPLARDSRTLKQIKSLHRRGAQVITIAAGMRVANDLTRLSPTMDREGDDARRGLVARIWSWVRTTNAPAIVVAPFFLVWLCTFLWQTLRTARQLPEASLFILHGVTSYPAFVLSARRVPFVYDIHDFYCGIEPAAEIGTFERAFLRPFIRFMESRCIAQAAETVTVSDGLATLVENSYGRRPLVFRNVHDLRVDQQPGQDIRARLGLRREDFLIVVIGNHKAGQRFGEFFAALTEATKDIHVALIGRGYEALTPNTAAAGLSDRVHVVGALAPHVIVPSVRSADVAALPYYGRSDNYSFSLPNGFFQSVGAGLPLLYPDLPEMRALAERYDMGLMVDWASPADITAKLSALRDDADLMARLRFNAAKASQELSWEHKERLWLKLVQRLVP